MNKKNRYYIVVTEWLYPTESGREIFNDFDDYDEALETAYNLVQDEIENYTEATKCEPSPITYNLKETLNTDGYIITDKKGLKDWWFQAKIVEVNYGI